MKVRLGFVPLTDCAPLAAAEALGGFADEGLEVEFSREASWATVRDKLAVGALDGAHMLAPMALAASAGVGSEPAQIVVPMALATGGAAVTLSARITAQTNGADPADALRTLVDRRRAQGASVLTFAVVFPYSIHAYLLRTWLERAGVDPDEDVRLTVAPPPRMAELLAGGVIEGFCAGEPWNAAAEAAGAGRIVARAADLWPRAPDKVLAVGRRWAEADPARLAAVIRVLSRGAAWADAPEHRAELARLLAEPRWVGISPELVAPGLAHLVFHRDEASRPRMEDAIWLAGQMRRWGQLDPSVAGEDLARRVYRPDVYEAAMLAAPEI
jgi:NitT/TauT family transport system ATP-binding protein/nitrate/nitrite transport system substrate-binding protein